MDDHRRPTTFRPHLRLTMSGDLPDGEQFSCNLAMVPTSSRWAAAGNALAENAVLTDYLNDGDQSIYADLAADCSAFWASGNLQMASRAVLKRVKIAGIAEDGRYVGGAREVAVNTPGAVLPDQGMFPHQVALKITLETDADLGRIKGGFYLPGRTALNFSPDTNLYTAGAVGAVRDAVATLIANIENSPGFDAAGFRVVIASQGRYNRNGTLRLAPGNHDVKRVNVGRRVDIQRRRANRLSEARIVDAPV